MLKNLEKESFNIESMKNRFNSFKNSIDINKSNIRKNNNDYNKYNYNNDNSSLLNDNDYNENEYNDYNDSQEFKVSDKQIKNLSDVADYRNKKFKHIYEQTKIVENISKDINSLTRVHSQKLESLEDNIITIKDDSEESYKTVLKVSKEDRNFKQNKCWILFLVLILIVLFLLIFFNMNK
jgi:hypothetical protein